MKADEVRIVELFPKASDRIKCEFVNLYKKVYSEPPYEESYTDEYIVREVWDKHFENGGWIFAAVSPDGSIVGFGCALPAENSWECGQFLSDRRDDLPFELSKACYMSEVGVHPDFRKQGLGTKLVAARVERAKEAGFTTYVMRTAQIGSNSKGMYLRFGAELIEELVQDVSEHALEISSKSNNRIYLHGSC